MKSNGLISAAIVGILLIASPVRAESTFGAQVVLEQNRTVKICLVHEKKQLSCGTTEMPTQTGNVNQLIQGRFVVTDGAV